MADITWGVLPGPACKINTSLSHPKADFGKNTTYAVQYFCLTIKGGWGASSVRTGLAQTYTLTGARLYLYTASSLYLAAVAHLRRTYTHPCVVDGYVRMQNMLSNSGPTVPLDVHPFEVFAGDMVILSFKHQRPS